MLESITKSKPKGPESDSFEKLETEIDRVVSSCRSLISKESLKEGQSFNKHVCGKISTIPESGESAIALEKVRDSYLKKTNFGFKQTTIRFCYLTI